MHAVLIHYVYTFQAAECCLLERLLWLYRKIFLKYQPHISLQTGENVAHCPQRVCIYDMASLCGRLCGHATCTR